MPFAQTFTNRQVESRKQRKMISVSILRAAGLTDEQIVRVIETEQKERQLARREQNRKSQQNHRSRQQISADRADNADTKQRAANERRQATVEDTPRARLFREGSAALLALGRTDRAARQLIGAWLKRTHDDDQLVLATILRARDLAVADAAGWVTATLKSKVKGNGERNPTMAAFDDLIARAEGSEVPRDTGIVDITPGRPQGR
jgi:DNA-directed RNA polymerase beta subunit